MNLISIKNEQDIPNKYAKTPIGDLLRYHNLNLNFKTYTSAEILIGMCMDNRKTLKIPDNFAYILRTGGANLRYSEFKLAYAIAIGKVRHAALIGHNECGMKNLLSKKEAFVKGIIKIAKWTQQRAEDYLMHYAGMFEIDNEQFFVLEEAND